MIQIKKATMWKALGGLGLLIAVMAAALVLVPAVAATYDACGDGVCDPNSENTDLCVADCACTDNGVADPGEGCNCRDVVCATEKPRTACGTPCGAAGECPAGLACFQGVCWEDCICENLCGQEAPEPACLEIGEECTSDDECCEGECGGIAARTTSPTTPRCCLGYLEPCTSSDQCCAGPGSCSLISGCGT